MDYSQYWNIIESVQNELSASLTIHQRELLLRNERESITPSWNEYKKTRKSSLIFSHPNTDAVTHSYSMNHPLCPDSSEINAHRSSAFCTNLKNRYRGDSSVLRGVSDPVNKESRSLSILNSGYRLPASSRGDSLEAPLFYDPVPSPLTHSPKPLPSLASLTLPPLEPVDCKEGTLKSLDNDAFMHESTLDHYLNGSMDRYDTIKNPIKTELLIASLDAPKDNTLRKMFEEEEQSSILLEPYDSQLQFSGVNTLAIDNQEQSMEEPSWSNEQATPQVNEEDSPFFPVHYQPQHAFKPLSPILYTSTTDLVTSAFVPSPRAERLLPLDDQPLEMTNILINSDQDDSSNRKSSLMSFASSHTMLSSQQLTNGPIQADLYNFSDDEPSNESMWEDYRDSTLDGVYLSKRFTERYWIEKEQEKNDIAETIEETIQQTTDDSIV